jgi:hypothetical protein
MLYPITTVYPDFILIIHPGHTKNNRSLWLNKTVQKTMLSIAGMLNNKRPNTLHDFINCLLVFGLTWIMFGYISTELLKAFISHLNSPLKTIVPILLFCLNN